MAFVWVALMFDFHGCSSSAFGSEKASSRGRRRYEKMSGRKNKLWRLIKNDKKRFLLRQSFPPTGAIEKP